MKKYKTQPAKKWTHQDRQDKAIKQIFLAIMLFFAAAPKKIASKKNRQAHKDGQRPQLKSAQRKNDWPHRFIIT